MSTDAEDIAPVGSSLDHLTKELHPESQYTDLKDREYMCEECPCRVTVSPDGLREYGHHEQCDHRERRSGKHPNDNGGGWAADA